MKKIKLLLTVPALTSAFIPLVSCGDSKSNIEIKLQSEKSITSKTHITYFHFTLSKEVSKDKIQFNTINETQPACGIYSKYLELDGTDLYLYIVFDSQDSTGKYSFDLEFTISNMVTKFEGLSVTFAPDATYLPRQALVIEDGVLKGLNSEFKTADVYTWLIIPEDVTSIAENAFKDAFSKTSTDYKIRYISLPSELTSIGANAFAGCDNIETLSVSRLPVSTEQSPITIGTDAFKSWADSGEIIYAESAKSYELLDYQLIDNGLGKDWFETEGVVRKLPVSDLVVDGTTLTGTTWDSIDKAPNHLNLVTQLIIPSNVTIIGDNAFWDSTNNKSKLPTNITTLSLPEGLTSIGKYAFYHANFTDYDNTYDREQLVTPTTLTSIGELAFGYVPMQGLVFNSELVNISTGAFYNCNYVWGIDVTAFNSIPSWSTTKTTFGFETEASAAWIYCKPALASKWKNYFQSAGLDFNIWSITENIKVVDEGEVTTYTPTYGPLDSYTYTKQEALDRYHVAIADEPHLIDDIIFTFCDNAVDKNFDNLEITITSADYSTKALSFSILYSAKFKNDENTYSGTISASYFNTETLNNVTIEANPTTTQIMKFGFKDFLNGSVGLPLLLVVETTTTPDGTTTLTTDQTYLNIEGKKLTDVTETELGKVISALGIFTKTGNDVYLNINSHFMGKCSIKEE